MGPLECAHNLLRNLYPGNPGRKRPMGGEIIEGDREFERPAGRLGVFGCGLSEKNWRADKQYQTYTFHRDAIINYEKITDRSWGARETENRALREYAYFSHKSGERGYPV